MLAKPDIADCWDVWCMVVPAAVTCVVTCDAMELVAVTTGCVNVMGADVPVEGGVGAMGGGP